MFYKNSKKGVTEIISYLLLTFLVVIISSITYLFAQDYITDIKQEQDLSQMEVHLKKISFLVDTISSFDRDTSTYYLSFSTGQLETRNNELIYASQVRYTGGEVCLSQLCYNSRNGYEIVVMSLPPGYTFSESITILPGNHFIQLEHFKEGEVIDVALK